MSNIGWLASLREPENRVPFGRSSCCRERRLGRLVNFLGEADEARVHSSYGEDKFQQLARIKVEYDPDNVFHLNANIRPAVH